MLKHVKVKPWFMLGYFALLLECTTPILAAFLQRDIINNVFTDGEYDQFHMLITLYAIFFFGPKLWFSVRKITFFHIHYNMQKNMTEAFIFKVYQLARKNYNNEHNGKLLNDIRHDISDACNIIVNEILSEGVKVFISILFLSISIAYISVKMLLIIAVVASLYYILLNKFGEKTKENAKGVRKEKANLSMIIEESVSATREVVAFNQGDQQMKRFENKFQMYYKALIKEGLYRIKIIFISEPLLYITKITVILFGAANAIVNNVSLGEFVVSFALVDQLVNALGQLFQRGLAGKRFLASVSCIQSLMNQEFVEYGHETLEDDISSIKFEELTFSYDKSLEPVINNISLDIPVGKKVAFVGESGSGKSTLAQLMLRVYEADKGQISINGRPIHQYKHNYTDRITSVQQGSHFLPISLMENIVLDKEYDLEDIDSICKEMLAYDFIQKLPDKFDTKVGEKAVKLSGGQKQRLALVRSILKNTDVLVLDEATSALDTKTEYHVQMNIDRLRQGKTIIIIAHRMSTIKNADLIYVLNKGQVINKGTHEELLGKCFLYKRLYSMAI
jgi:ABC-type multidrug transport system fused ATPase/permease subunit